MDNVAHDEYNRLVNLLLLDFQWIEEYLRVNISASYALIARSVKPPSAFRPNLASLERDALGKLIEKFDQVSLKQDLCKELRSLVSARNHCAHKALIVSLDEQQSDFFAKESARLAPIRERTRSCVIALNEVLIEFSAALKELPVDVAERGIQK